LKYSDQPWAHKLAGWLGGFDNTGLWHHILGIVTVLYLVIHVVWLVAASLRQVRLGAKPVGLVLGPNSPVPNLRDLKDMFAMFRWFFGLGPKPTFERWAYWEKFDYWAVFWGVGIIGTSGFMLWWPNLFCRILPGEVLNVAKIIHSEEALLATGFIFAIHFFNSHFRPEKFPMDMSVLCGMVTDEELREERPEYYERLQREGKLEKLRGTVPSRRTLWFIGIGGTVALVIGLSLLAGMLVALFRG
jgi:thiosulfate reductase cytochrome b subunit